MASAATNVSGRLVASAPGSSAPKGSRRAGRSKGRGSLAWRPPPAAAPAGARSAAAAAGDAGRALADIQAENERLRQQLEAETEADALRAANAELRAAVGARLPSMPEAARAALLAEHAALRAAAAAAGERIPALPGAPDEEGEAAAAPAAAAPKKKGRAKKAEVVKMEGAVVEVEPTGTLTFHFGAADAPSPPVGNGGAGSALHVPPRVRRVAAGAAGKGKGVRVEEGDDAVVFRFDEPAAKPAAAPAAAAAAAAGAAAGAAASAAAAAAAEAETKAASGRKKAAAAAAGAAAAAPKAAAPRAKAAAAKPAAAAAAPATPPAAPAAPQAAAPAAAAPRAPPPKPADPHAAARAAAAAEVAGHDAAAVAAGREHWLFITVPEEPVPGAPCALYLNKAVSDPLRHRPAARLHAKANGWELDAGPESAAMAPAPGAPRGEGLDLWVATLDVPADAYELNFIFSDGEGTYDNNGTQNYVKACAPGRMSRERWVDEAPERAEAAFLARRAAEAAAAAAAAAEREAAAAAADEAAAAAAVAELKDRYDAWRAGASGGEPGRWAADPAAPPPGGAVRLLYNRLAGPIGGFDVPADQRLTLRAGHNGWRAVADHAMSRAAAPPPGAPPGGEWWEASVPLPAEAASLEFVVSYYEHFDNNGGADFRVAAALPRGAASPAAWADSLAPALLASIRGARRAAEAAAAAEAERREAARVAAQARALEVRRRQMQHVLYTEPAVVTAGAEVTVFYNPDNASLPGRREIWLRGGFNRWRHPKPFGPLRMAAPAAGGHHFSATVPVPKDAYSLDFVFSEAAEGDCAYDNRGGLDWHLPVEGSVVHEPPLYVAHIAVEMAPIAKVGGMGDVVTALGRAVQEKGHLVEVIVPRYDFFLQSPLLGGTTYETEFDYGGTRIFVSTCVVEGLRVWFIEPRNGMFATNSVYVGAADVGRFEFFSRAALEFLLRTGRQPDVIHCHDWSTADVAKAYWNDFHPNGLHRPAVVFTIHNLNYGQAKIGEAAYYSQRFTTVSPSYAWEIGGEPAVAPNVGKLMGILNGIDYDIWNPETDQFLPRGYTAASVDEGKAAARAELRRRVGLAADDDRPVVAVVTRLTKQKGTHLIAHSAFRALDRGAQFVLLGSAPDPKVQAEFDGLASQYGGGGRAAFCFAFDEPLSHLIYAAADVVLVPSMFEPCGLTQMIAMRYGAVPVVRSTGGLKDTVFDVDNDKARAAWALEGSTDWQADGVDATNGFSFEGTDAGALDYALNRALDAFYNDRAWFRSLQRRVMEQDWSWNKPALDYIQLYHSATKR